MANPFERTKIVVFELSNLCNFAWLHTKCPLHRTMADSLTPVAPHILETHLIHQSLEIMAAEGWAGEVNFHQYNEPLLDGRLFGLVKAARLYINKGFIRIVTNGFYLTLDYAKELQQAGVNLFEITPYSPRIFDLAEAMDNAGIPVHVLNYPLPGLLDDRLNIYDRPVDPRPQPCYEPLVDLNVTCQGKVALCCQDWDRRTIFGDLHYMRLDQIVGSVRVRECYERLSRGDRYLDVCRRCDTGRGL